MKLTLNVTALSNPDLKIDGAQKVMIQNQLTALVSRIEHQVDRELWLANTNGVVDAQTFVTTVVKDAVDVFDGLNEMEKLVELNRDDHGAL